MISGSSAFQSGPLPCANRIAEKATAEHAENAETVEISFLFVAEEI
jgi:hypothetical protein